MDEAEEVFDVVFPLGDRVTEGVQPSERPLNLSPSAIAAQLAFVLDAALAPAPVGAINLMPYSSASCVSSPSKL